MAWKIDPAHTRIEFSARHMMVTTVRGEFEKFTGTVDFEEKNPANTSVNVEIQTGSLNTRVEQRDAHLRSADFFEAEKYPIATFQSKNVIVKDSKHARLLGDLTIRGITKEVTLDVEFTGLVKNPWGSTVAGFNARAKFNRKDWGLAWNVAIESGGVLVGEEITLNIEAELIEEVPATAQAASTKA